MLPQHHWIILRLPSPFCGTANHCTLLHQSKNSLPSHPSLPFPRHAKLHLSAQVSTNSSCHLDFLENSQESADDFWKLIQGSLTPTAPLDYFKAPLPILWHCPSLHPSAPKQEQSSLSSFSNLPETSAKLPLSAQVSTNSSCHPGFLKIHRSRHCLHTTFGN